jgi:hypothetical protein
MIHKFTIYGERCSGTNYLEQLMLLNFEVDIVWDYGWKHFFGFHDLTNSEDVLFIGIVRNLPDWVNSLYREKHHLPPELIKNIDTYLNGTFYSLQGNNELISNFYPIFKDEILFDRNLETNKRYRNIFELRHVKNKFLIETMPTLVKNYCLITYDNLLENFDSVMEQIKNYGLQVKSNIEFPLNTNIHLYKGMHKYSFKKKQNEIPDIVILEKANLFYEKILFPNTDFLSIEKQFLLDKL